VNSQKLLIRTSDLTVGTKVNFDLVDQSGLILLKAGGVFTQEVREELQRRGIETVTVFVRRRTEARSENEVLVSSYDAQGIKRIEQGFAASETAIRSCVQEIQSGRSPDSNALRRQLDALYIETKQDASAVLAILSLRINRLSAEQSQRLVERAVQFSWLSMVTAIHMQWSLSDTVAAGLAAALHDVSLVTHPEFFDTVYRDQSKRIFNSDYQRHPIESVELLHGAIGLNEAILTAITQVHEQIDSSGFPKGLRSNSISPIGRLLNVIDAYLEMVIPMFREDGIIPSDAVACLCWHASRGKFDRPVVQAVVQCLSMYPIGTPVELSNSSRAIVVRSAPDSPMQPLVIDVATGESIDLQKTNLRIVSPASPIAGPKRRLAKNELAQVLWDNLQLVAP
jgi:response regulator RpfG family c-di-GMP phosphodiesterase